MTRRCGRVLALLLALTVTIPATAEPSVRDQVRVELLDRINRDRERHGLRPVELDKVASEIADQYCGAQVETGTRGHFSIDGLAPYMRYSFAGVHDNVLENAASWSARDVVPESVITELAQKSHSEMIAEIPPKNGHRKAILDPYVTHVGIGVSWGGSEVRIVEALLRRHLEWTSARQRAVPGERIRFGARVLNATESIAGVTIHHEPFPYRLSRDRANTIDSYGLPPVWLRLERDRPRSAIVSATGPERNPRYSVDGDRISFDLALSNGRGIYTIVVWLRRAGEERPFAATNLSVIADWPAEQASTSSR